MSSTRQGPPGVDPKIWELLQQHSGVVQSPVANLSPTIQPVTTVGDLYDRPSNLSLADQAPLGFADLMDTGPNTVPRGWDPAFLNWSDISNQNQAEIPRMT